MRKILFLICIIFLTLPLISAATYGENTYGCGLYGQGCSDVEEVVGAPTGGGGAIAIQFDIRILEFESPITLGESFDFTYFVKGVGTINNDVTIDFWIEKDEEIITSGSDVIFMGTNEEKTESASLFLPSDIESGEYKFVIKVSYGNIKAEAHRTIELIVREGEVEIVSLFDITFSLEDSSIQSPDELTAVVTFENFGTIPIGVNLTFIILDESGDEYAVDHDFIVVTTEEVLRKKFEALYLPDGKYTLVLQTLYNTDVFDEFRQDFEIGKEKRGITGMTIDFVKGEGKWYGIGIIIIILIIWLVWCLLGKRKKKHEKKKKRRIKYREKSIFKKKRSIILIKPKKKITSKIKKKKSPKKHKKKEMKIYKKLKKEVGNL